MSVAEHRKHGATSPTGHQEAAPAQDTAAALVAVEQAMIRLRRSVSRRNLGRRAAEEVFRQVGAELGLSQLAVVDAVEEGAAGPDHEVTVGLVAERLAIDPSRASRHVSTAIKAGLVLRVASQADGRQVHLELTDRGQRVAAAMHTARQRAFDEVMRDWSNRDRREFARLLTKFTE
ncbi:MAG: MarR family winged helix-turn-helix transcriptional regulator [Pseudonocardia sp.]